MNVNDFSKYETFLITVLLNPNKKDNEFLKSYCKELPNHPISSTSTTFWSMFVNIWWMKCVISYQRRRKEASKEITSLDGTAITKTKNMYNIESETAHHNWTTTSNRQRASAIALWRRTNRTKTICSGLAAPWHYSNKKQY